MTDLEIKEMKKQYTVQKAGAKRRKIEFLLSFEEWKTLWLESGKWNERGRFSNQYCMCRTNDTGAYKIGNVRIDTVSNNIKENRLTEDWKKNNKIQREKMYQDEEVRKKQSKKTQDYIKENRLQMEKMWQRKIKPVIATCLVTGKEMRLNGAKEMKAAGFHPVCVSRICRNDIRYKTHKNHTFKFEV